MNKTLAIIIGLIMSLTATTIAENWVQQKDFPEARNSMVAFSINNIGYAGLGEIEYGKYSNTFFKYDQEKDEWEAIADFPGTARKGSVSFVINGKAYIGLGKSKSSETKDFYRYDPTNNSWEKIADFGGIARTNAVAFTINNKAYVGTGRADDPLKDMWEYDPINDSWTQVANYHSALHNAFAFAINGKGYICSGISVGNGTYMYSGVDEYNPTNNTWKEKIYAKGELQNRHYATAFTHNNVAYICGGNSSITKTLTYTPSSNTVQSYNDFFFQGDEYQEPTSFVIGNKAYVIGGLYYEGTSIFNSVSVYKKDVWSLQLENSNNTPQIKNNDIEVVNLQTGQFVIKGIQENEPYAIVNINGATVLNGQTQSGQTTIDMTNHPQGLYLIKTQNKTLKFIR